jgi:hypothetical protein
MKNDNCLETSSVVSTISRPYANFIHLMLQQSTDDPSTGMDSTLKMASAGDSEMLVTSYQTTRSQISQNCDLHRYHIENFISRCYLKTPRSFKTEDGVFENQEHLKSHTPTWICVSNMLVTSVNLPRILFTLPVTKFRSKNCYTYSFL